MPRGRADVAGAGLVLPLGVAAELDGVVEGDDVEAHGADGNLRGGFGVRTDDEIEDEQAVVFGELSRDGSGLAASERDGSLDGVVGVGGEGDAVDFIVRAGAAGAVPGELAAGLEMVGEHLSQFGDGVGGGRGEVDHVFAVAGADASGDDGHAVLQLQVERERAVLIELAAGDIEGGNLGRVNAEDEAEGGFLDVAVDFRADERGIGVVLAGEGFAIGAGELEPQRSNVAAFGLEERADELERLGLHLLNEVGVLGEAGIVLRLGETLDGGEASATGAGGDDERARLGVGNDDVGGRLQLRGVVGGVHVGDGVEVGGHEHRVGVGDGDAVVVGAVDAKKADAFGVGVGVDGRRFEQDEVADLLVESIDLFTSRLDDGVVVALDGGEHGGVVTQAGRGVARAEHDRVGGGLLNVELDVFAGHVAGRSGRAGDRAELQYRGWCAVACGGQAEARLPFDDKLADALIGDVAVVGAFDGDAGIVAVGGYKHQMRLLEIRGDPLAHRFALFLDLGDAFLEAVGDRLAGETIERRGDHADRVAVGFRFEAERVAGDLEDGDLRLGGELGVGDADAAVIEEGVLQRGFVHGDAGGDEEGDGFAIGRELDADEHVLGVVALAEPRAGKLIDIADGLGGGGGGRAG